MKNWFDKNASLVLCAIIIAAAWGLNYLPCIIGNHNH